MAPKPGTARRGERGRVEAVEPGPGERRAVAAPLVQELDEVAPVQPGRPAPLVPPHPRR